MVLMASMNILSAVLLMLVSLPLWYRKVPMNSFYGARFRESFKSERNWYEINAEAGRLLMLSSLPILFYGVIGFALPLSALVWYSIGSAVVNVASILVASVQSYIAARRIDKGN